MSGDLSGAGNFGPELRELREENAALKKKLATAEAHGFTMSTALGEVLEAIDAVESEPGRPSGAQIFAVDWFKMMKLVKDFPPLQCLEQFVAAALRETAGHLAAAEKFAGDVEAIARKHGFATSEAKGNLLAFLDLALAGRKLAEHKLQGVAAELTATRRAYDETQRQLRAVKAGVGDVWRWQPDGGNHVDTMTDGMPVVMTADTVRDVVALRVALEDRGCERGREIPACLDSKNPCATCSALGAFPL